jgi:hypothetical protein
MSSVDSDKRAISFITSIVIFAASSVILSGVLALNIPFAETRKFKAVEYLSYFSSTIDKA